MDFVNLSDLKAKEDDALSTTSRTTVSSGFRVKNHKKLPGLNDRPFCTLCTAFTSLNRPCKKMTLTPFHVKVVSESHAVNISRSH
eukprot:3904665-Prymnesium_polylepis.1